jgi:hypothetical protein
LPRADAEDIGVTGARVDQDVIGLELLLPTFLGVLEEQESMAVSIKLNDALRSRLRLLPPQEIRKKMEALGLNQQQFAELMGVVDAAWQSFEPPCATKRV